MQPLEPARKPHARSARVLAWVVAIIVVAAAGMAGGGWATRYLIREGHWSAGDNTNTAAAQDDSEQWYTCGMHPEVLQKGPGDCPICKMKLTPLKSDSAVEAADERERKILYWRAPMNPNFVSDRPGKSPMGMDLVPVYGGKSELATAGAITIAPEFRQNMGIRTAVVQRGPLIKTIRTVGRVDYDERTVTFINTKFDGYIEELHVDETGVQVEAGQPLFDVYSPKLYSAQEEYLAALRGVERMANSTLPEMREGARSLVEAAVTQLQYFDVSDEQIERLRETKQIQKTLTIHSPARGIVTEKMALQGMYVKPGMRLYTIADLSHVWVYVDIYEYQLPWVRIGQAAKMSLSYIPGREFIGRVVYVYPYLEKQTRVVKVRLEFDNPMLALKPEMYANVLLEANLNRDALLLPREAFIDSGTRKLVFVYLGEGKFEPRDIQTGVETEEGLVEVLYGLDEGDTIVVSGQFLLDAESKLREATAKMMARKSGEATKVRPTEQGGRISDEGDAAGGEHAYEDESGGTGIPEDARYACSMETHPDEADAAKRGAYFSAEPGRCEICNMALKPLDELDWVQARIAAGEADVGYTCPDHPHVLGDKSGQCPRCEKQLEAFKVMYTCSNPDHSAVAAAQPGDCPHGDGALVPFRGVWLSPEMADHNMPPKPELAESAAFRCSVHPLVHSDAPGSCSICGLDLVGALPESAEPTPAARRPIPADAEFVCPMHPDQIRANRQGACSICGMSLVHVDSLPRPKSAPAAVAVRVNYLMEHYLELQKRFAADKTTDVAQHALGLAAAADDLEAKLREPEVDLPPEFAAALQRLRSAALKTNGKSIEADRVTFVDLSAAMRTLVEHVRPDRTRYPDIYIYHCPMSKGDWLQTSENMANPYYGFKMLKCGDLISRD